MQSVGQGVTVPIASASPVALTFATPNDVAWWVVAALTGCHRLGTVPRGWLANQTAISTKSYATFGAPIGQERGFVWECRHLGARFCVNKMAV